MGERTRLGLWIWLPFLAWIAVWIAALSMPASDCDGSGTDTGTEGALLIALVATASLAAAIAAVLVAVALAPRVEVVAVAGLVLTGLAFVSLLVAWLAGSSVDRLGLLPTLYLLGAALFAYPLVGLLGLLASSGIGC